MTSPLQAQTTNQCARAHTHTHTHTHTVSISNSDPTSPIVTLLLFPFFSISFSNLHFGSNPFYPVTTTHPPHLPPPPHMGVQVMRKVRAPIPDAVGRETALCKHCHCILGGTSETPSVKSRKAAKASCPKRPPHRQCTRGTLVGWVCSAVPSMGGEAGGGGGGKGGIGFPGQ